MALAETDKYYGKPYRFFTLLALFLMINYCGQCITICSSRAPSYESPANLRLNLFHDRLPVISDLVKPLNQYLTREYLPIFSSNYFLKLEKSSFVDLMTTVITIIIAFLD